ncbi:hypothetical protein ACEPAH_4182 [Sanghuangporus vaninii]
MLVYGVLLLALLAGALPSSPIIEIREPKASLPFARRINATGTTIPAHDRARAAHLLSLGKSRASGSQPAKRQSSIDVINEVVTYVAEVGVGNPPTTYSLLIDTGSSNTWLGASKAYVLTSTSRTTGNLVTVTYGSGFFAGSEFTDTVTFTKNLTITGQSIGVAVIAEGFQGVDGILGIGPTDLTEGTLIPSLAAIPTVTDNLFSQGKISQEVVGIFFAPTTTESATNGEMTFGGVDTAKTTGEVVFTPITSTSPASEFFGIDQMITYGDNGTTVLPSTAGITDTGTTLILLETDAFNTYTSLTGATEDATTGLLSISPENYANLQSLFFNIGGTTFEFTKNAQTWPRSLNTDIGGSADDIFLVLADLGTLGGEGLDFINGFTFLERFYSVFDSSNSRVGFATTAHTFDETN